LLAGVLNANKYYLVNNFKWSKKVLTKVRNILFKTELFGVIASFVQQRSLNLGVAILSLLPSLLHDILFTEVYPDLYS